jgi:hypothetical protein
MLHNQTHIKDSSQDSLKTKRQENNIAPLKVFFKNNINEIKNIAPNFSLGDYNTESYLAVRIPAQHINLPACSNGNAINILLCKFSATKSLNSKAKNMTLHISDFFPYKIGYYYQLQTACQTLVSLLRQLTQESELINVLFQDWLHEITNTAQESLSTFNLDLAIQYISNTLVAFGHKIHSPELESMSMPNIIQELRQTLFFDMPKLMLSNTHISNTLSNKKQKFLHQVNQSRPTVSVSNLNSFQGWCINALQHKFLNGRRDCMKNDCIFEHRIPTGNLTEDQKSSMKVTINKMKNEDFKGKLLKAIA